MDAGIRLNGQVKNTVGRQQNTVESLLVSANSDGIRTCQNNNNLRRMFYVPKPWYDNGLHSRLHVNNKI